MKDSTVMRKVRAAVKAAKKDGAEIVLWLYCCKTDCCVVGACYRPLWKKDNKISHSFQHGDDFRQLAATAIGASLEQMTMIEAGFHGCIHKEANPSFELYRFGQHIRKEYVTC